MNCYGACSRQCVGRVSSKQIDRYQSGERRLQPLMQHAFKEGVGEWHWPNRYSSYAPIRLRPLPLLQTLKSAGRALVQSEQFSLHKEQACRFPG
jgi:hypothetical protein